MRGVALSDLHLGFRAFSATIRGRNAREVDVEEAWMEAARIIGLQQPDLVTIAGDCFHHPRVGSHAVKAFRDGLGLISDAGIPVVIIPGNHDAGRTADVLTPVVIPDDLPGIYVVDTIARLRLRTRSGERVAVTCVPFTVLQPTERTWAIGEPDPDVDVNVMVIHAAVNTTADEALRLPSFYAGHDSLDVGKLAEAYDVIAAGDYHEHRRLHPERLAFYSGSLERTSSNVWQEHDPKGFVVYDTATGEMELREIPTRTMVDDSFARISDGIEEPNAENLNEMLELLLELGEEGTISRLKVDDLPRSEKDAIDWSLVRQLKQACLHFQLDISYTASEYAAGDRRDRRGRSLLDEAQDYFAEDEEAVRELVLAELGGGS